MFGGPGGRAGMRSGSGIVRTRRATVRTARLRTRKRRSSRRGGGFPIWGRASCCRFCSDAMARRTGRRPRRSATSLERGGLIKRVRLRRRPLDPPRREIAAEAANDEWAADFKGWFRKRDQARIDPLTITDSHTRFRIETRITTQTVEGAREVFTRAFATYGLTQPIRCDNGAPFGSQGAGGLTRLSAWWLKLGVEPHFIRPASPQENGRHERAHRTLKKQTSQPPAADAQEQQCRAAFKRLLLNLRAPWVWHSDEPTPLIGHGKNDAMDAGTRYPGPGS